MQRIGWAILILVTLYICYFSHLGVIGFVGPDEPRYAWIARDMAESGDWVTPRLYGKPWFEKPPLLYWGGAIFFKLLGEGHPEIAARLPSAISALLASLALAWLAWRTCGEECARWLLVLLPTSVGMIGFSRAAATDMPFTGMLTIAMVCAASVLGLVSKNENPPIPRTNWLALTLFGFFLGLAVLAKGPAAIILSGGAVLFWAVFTKRWREALRLLHPAAIAAFCATALPWYVLCSRRNSDFFRIFIIEHNFKRYLTPEFQHVQPFWFYLPILFIAFLPWSILVLAVGLAGARQLARTRCMQELPCLVLCWAVFCLVFFTVAKSKLPGYILPAVPAIALLVAYSVTGREWFSRRFAGFLLAASGGLGLGGAITLRLSDPLTPSYIKLPSSLTQTAIGVLIFFSLATIFAAWSFFAQPNSNVSFWLGAACSLFIILLLQLTPEFMERTNLDVLSGKWMARAASSEVPDLEKLRTFGYRRDYRYALNFYLHREVPDWTEAPIRDGYVLSNLPYCDKLKTLDHCEDLWGMRDFVPRGALLRITPKNSLDRPGAGRQPRQEK
jgi:4-amino-4-deoxy-L-arabinose transferase-like glycosyltransferase